MIRPDFLSQADRRTLEACVRRQREDHDVARRANAMLLLDDGESGEGTRSTNAMAGTPWRVMTGKVAGRA